MVSMKDGSITRAHWSLLYAAQRRAALVAAESENCHSEVWSQGKGQSQDQVQVNKVSSVLGSGFGLNLGKGDAQGDSDMTAQPSATQC